MHARRTWVSGIDRKMENLVATANVVEFTAPQKGRAAADAGLAV